MRRRSRTIWKSMKNRCFDVKNPYYGGRGVKLCERWRSYNNFVADMGEPPSDIHSLDRIDVNKGYSPDNCRWATPEQQVLNRRPRRNFWFAYRSFPDDVL